MINPSGNPVCRRAATRLPVIACCLAAIPAFAVEQRQLTEYKLAPAAHFRDRPAIAQEPYQADGLYRLMRPELPATSVVAAPPSPPRPYAAEIDAAAKDAGVEPALVHAVVAVESAYKPGALSPKGAVGLMQVLPETAIRYGIHDPAPVKDNLRAGTLHLKTLIRMFGNDRIDLVLAAYNAGEGAVRRHNNTIPPYRETRQYVPAVMRNYQPPSVPSPPLKASSHREYMAGTRLDADAIAADR